ncbi:MAG TPA: regulator, partial [Galbitalea sp.]
MRIAFALPLEAEDRLSAEAIRHGHEIVARCTTGHELASRIEAVAPDVAIVAATERHLTSHLVSICDEAGVRILALVANEMDRRHAGSLGLLESVDAAAKWQDLERELSVIPARQAASQEPAPATAAPTTGTVIAVWGPAGAPGRTTLAINIAAELAAAGRTVALADVDTYSGSIAPTLGMLDEAPGFAAACRLAGADSL